MNLQCENCDKIFSNFGGFASHKKNCTISKPDRQKIRDLYRSGQFVVDIVNMGYTRNQVNRCVKDLKRTASETLKISHSKAQRKKVNNFSNNRIVCSKCNKSFNKGNFERHTCLKYTDIDIEKVRSLYKSGQSPSEIVLQGFSTGLIKHALRQHRRSAAEASKLAHTKYSFKWSEESKQRFSEKCKKLHKEERANTWHRQSYAEKVFFEFLINQGYEHNKQFFTEFPFSIYRADFYFPELALVIEIDGKQHYRYIRRKIIDDKKDQLIKSKNIDVFRISWQAIFKDSKTKFDQIAEILKHKETRNVLMSEFTNNQLRCLHALDEIANRKQCKSQEIESSKQLLRQNQVNKILQSNINFSKFGWVKQVAIILNKRPQKINRWMRKNMLEFYEKNCFKRAKGEDSNEVPDDD
jgi:very-short-patch-repair endonuclease